MQHGIVRFRLAALAVAMVLSCVFSAEADYYMYWAAVDAGLKSSYASSSTILVGHKVYLMLSAASSSNYAGPNAIYKDMAGGMTVSDIKARAHAVYLTNGAGLIDQHLVEMASEATTNVFMCSFSDDEKFVYFSRALSMTPKAISKTPQVFSRSFDVTFNETKSEVDYPGWYRVPQRAYLRVTVEPVKTNVVTTAIGGTESLAIDDGNFLVETNKTFDIVYTTVPGTLFSDGSNRKSRSFKSTDAWVKDDEPFEFIEDPHPPTYYVNWSTSSGKLADPAELKRPLAGHPVYLVGYKNRETLFANMKTGAVTVHDVERLAAGIALTTRDGAVEKMKVPFGTSSIVTNLCMVSFSPDTSYVYMSSTIASIKSTTTGAKASDYNAASWVIAAVVKTGDPTSTSGGGWYATPQKAYLRVGVKPAKGEHLAAAIGGIVSVSDGSGNFLVETNKAFDIVYTPASGYVFNDGTYEKRHACSSAGWVDDSDATFEIVEAACRIGDRGFSSFSDALADVRTGETIVLLQDANWTPQTCSVGLFKVDPNGHAFTCMVPQGVRTDWKDGVCEIEGDYFEVMNLAVGSDSVTTNKFTYFTNVLAQTSAAYEDMTNLFLLRDVTFTTSPAVNKSVAFSGGDYILSAPGFTYGNGATFTIKNGLVDVPYSASIILVGGRFNSNKDSYKKTTTGWASHDPADGYVFSKKYSAVLKPTVRDFDVQCIRKDLVDGKKFDTTADPTATNPKYDLQTFTDTRGHVLTLVVDRQWAWDLTGNKVNPEARSALFSQVMPNGLTLMECGVLGMMSNTKTSVEPNEIPVIAPVQSTNADKISLKLGNTLAVGALDRIITPVKYRVFSSDVPGGREGGASEEIKFTGSETVEMPLPTSGVKYYNLEVELDAVQ